MQSKSIYMQYMYSTKAVIVHMFTVCVLIIIINNNNKHHPSADVDRLYAPCSDGGRGLKQIESAYQSCIVRLNSCLADSSDPFIYTDDTGVTPENLYTRSSAWLVTLLHSCGGVLLRTTSCRAYTGIHPSRLKVASSKRLKQMRDITVRVAVLFVCDPGAESLCTESIAVSLSNRL